MRPIDGTVLGETSGNRRLWVLVWFALTGCVSSSSSTIDVDFDGRDGNVLFPTARAVFRVADAAPERAQLVAATWSRGQSRRPTTMNRAAVRSRPLLARS